MTMRDRVTARQRDILVVVAHNGPITAGDVSYHLPGWRSVEAYRAACARLEHRGLLDADYTAHRGRGRAYTISERGNAALLRWEVDEP